VDAKLALGSLVASDEKLPVRRRPSSRRSAKPLPDRMALKQNAESAYGPDPLLVGFWCLLTSIPVIMDLYSVVSHGPHANVIPWLVSVAPPLLTLGFAARFRVIFTADTVVYRHWGKTIRVRYDQISKIEITNVTPIEKQPIGAFLVTHRGERFPFWPKLFPKEAVARFTRLADYTA
jgi:hypothetical protein